MLDLDTSGRGSIPSLAVIFLLLFSVQDYFIVVIFVVFAVILFIFIRIYNNTN